jgi:hypothetical protein
VQVDCRVNVWHEGPQTEHYEYWLTYDAQGIASGASDWLTLYPQNRPDSVWLPVRQREIPSFWQGELDMDTIEAIIPLEEE